MAVGEALSALLCGASDGRSSLAGSLSHLSDTLVRLVAALPAPFGDDDDINPLYAPFLARSILEVSCAALIARLDPFRVLSLAQIQSQASYDPGRRIAASLQWQGDVVADAKQDVWSIDRKPEQMTRALLGDYQEAIVWRPAFDGLLDRMAELSPAPVGRWSQELLTWPSEQFVPRTRVLAAKVYSLASKGIHHEFVLPRSSYYDIDTLTDLIEDTMRVSASLGLVVNYCDHAVFGVGHDDSISLFEALQ